MAWGSNSDGQLGIGSNSSQVTPQLVQTADGTLAGITAISAEDYESLALDAVGRIWAWGDGYGLNPDPYEDSTDWTLAGQLLEGEDAQLGFTDEQKIGAWAKSAIAKSMKAGIVSGYGDGSFRPSANIMRTELAVMVARAYGVSDQAATSTGFADDGDIPAWAKSAIAQVKASGIVSGQGDNRFAPDENATRAEAVTIILNLLKTG